MYQNQNMNNQFQQTQGIIAQLINQTQQSSQMYQQMLQQEQQNAMRLEELAQREQQAVQIIQSALHGHQMAIQQLQHVSQLCRQLEQTAQSSFQSPNMQQPQQLTNYANSYGSSFRGYQ
ncbi:hypothetical protein M5X11_33895 [Paenibacillus alginolyticus]|uniref:AMP-dependent synthetase and ligase n=1 Tax=Paenibacillus alginolyticus TaxID=59839 RepID=A0ABT4GJ20_9BACL|nr:hypothetical protein [Paenibacillus alginolyticus]MCY9669847.1 hypothetical protein [Paenibacillus alginolyticus]MCY9696199.1 hypothetical protein [Paenibacillus alginolyticus]MEC0142475.1 hypothetical protein [Paenibacillus alginolyticus]